MTKTSFHFFILRKVTYDKNFDLLSKCKKKVNC